MIYLDNAATTKPLPTVIDNVDNALSFNWLNPSSYYSSIEKEFIKKAKERISNVINASSSDEIFYTSGGSESNTWALRGYCDYCEINESSPSMMLNTVIITTPIEHESIMKTCKYLSNFYTVNYVKVDSEGFVMLDSLKKLCEEASLNNASIIVSIQFANNEIGTIQNIKKISKIVHSYNGILHVDAVQAFMKVPIDVQDLGIDMLSASGHKINSLKGIGFLYKKKSVNILPLIYGGSQEQGIRGGTENFFGIVGLDAAIKYHLLNKNIPDIEKSIRLKILDRLLSIKDVYLIGTDVSEKRLCNNINVYIKNVNNEMLQSLLAMDGIYISTGSACNSGTGIPSHVLSSIGLDNDVISCCIRITINADITDNDINTFINSITNHINTIRLLKGETK